MNETETPAGPGKANPLPPLPPLEATASPALIIETLLKRPAQLVLSIQEKDGLRISAILAIVAFLALAVYGFVIGTFSGGDQLLTATWKVSLGGFASAIICLPSLFIFASLSGATVTLRGIAGALAATLALAALLLIGFAPVAWIFSQSTESIVFIAILHLSFWFIGLGVGLRLLGLKLKLLGIANRFHMKVWTGIFVLVSLQMTTALRPVIGKSQDILPKEKKFFLIHWKENLTSQH
ncbi:MAG TPA: hypothetical protein VIT21_02935 [Chthoniobacterales bacterium]